MLTNLLFKNVREKPAMKMTGKIAALWAAMPVEQRDRVLCAIVTSNEVREELAELLSLCRSSERLSLESPHPGVTFPIQ